MEKDGVDSETIRKETGWHKGYDGKWRFEIDDSMIKINKTGALSENSDTRRYLELFKKAYIECVATANEMNELAQLDEKLSSKNAAPNTLGELLQHNELFEAYPQLKDIAVILDDIKDVAKGVFNERSGLIILNKGLTGKQLKDTLLHEIQHVVQNIERMADGSSPSYWGRRILNDALEEKNKIRNELRKESEKGTDIMAEVYMYDVYIYIYRMVSNGNITASDFARAYDRIAKEISGEKAQELFWDYAEATEKYYNARENIRDTSYKAYEATAGEIEARDVTNRANLTAEQRKNTRPDIDRTDVVFADSSTGISLSKDISEYPYNMQTVIKEYISSADKSIEKFIESFNSNNRFARHKISDVTENQIVDIKRLLGIDVNGFTNDINTNAVRHIEKRHGKNGVADSSMSNISDIARIGYVLKNYDDVEIAKSGLDEISSAEFRNSKNEPAPMLVFSKKINGTYYVAQAIPDSEYKKLWVVSAYINKREAGTQALDAEKKSQVGMSLASSASNNKIPQSEPVVNSILRKNSKKDTKKLSDVSDSGKQHSFSLDNSNDVGYNNTTNREVNSYEPTDEFRRLQEESRRMSEEDIQLYHSGERKIDDELRKRFSRSVRRIFVGANDNGVGNANGILNLNAKGNRFDVYEDDMMTTYEKINEKTPCGGEYSEIYYFDDNGNPIEAEKATKFVIRECDRDGNLIKETYGTK